MDVPFEDLVNEFYEAINRRDFVRCRQLLQQLQALSPTEPRLVCWWEYLATILIGEADQDWAAAEASYRRLLTTDLAAEPILHGRILLALAINLHSQARWNESIVACEESLALFITIGYVADQPFVWNQLASTYLTGFSYGDLGADVAEPAVAHCLRALAAFEQLSAPPPYLVNFRQVLLNTLGIAYSILGRWAEALPCFTEFLSLTTAANDQLHMSIACMNMGDAYLSLTPARQLDALAMYRQAWQHVAHFAGSPVQQAEVLLRLGFIHHQLGDYPVAIGYYDQAIRIHEKLRAGVTSEQARVGYFASVTPTYDHKILACLAAGNWIEAFNTVEQARSRALLDSLVAAAAEPDRDPNGQLASLAQVQAALPADALLVAYYTTGFVAVRERPRHALGPTPLRIAQEQTLIFTVSQTEITLQRANLSPNMLKPRNTLHTVEEHFLQPQIRRELFQRLIAPIAGKLAGKKRLYLLPHGPLHLVPFHALLAPDDETLLRPQGPSLVYAPSSSLLLQRHRRLQSPAAQSCLALGYNGAGSTRLRFAEAEATLVANHLNGVAVVGSADKADLLYQQARNYRILHIACHGAFNQAAPLQSTLQIAANERLAAQEIFDHVKLGCDLVVLSACESGLTRVQRGDELYGLLRAFTAAGAAALLATLWRVDERATVVVMDRFYHNVLAGLAYAEALQAAQLYVRSLTRAAAHDVLRQLLGDLLSSVTDPLADLAGPLPFAQPQYWAAFILFGDASL